jgi:lipopolysaccharide transport system ATP-binding protein
MGEVASRGRTVLFVSHNMAAVQRLCTKALLLHKGTLVDIGETDSIVARYLAHHSDSALSYDRPSDAPDTTAHIDHIHIGDEEGNPVQAVTSADVVTATIEFTLEAAIRGLLLSLACLDEHGTQIFGSAPQDVNLDVPSEPGSYRARISFPRSLFLPRNYRLRVVLWTAGSAPFDKVDSIAFGVTETKAFSNSPTGKPRPGMLAIHCRWSVESVD